MALLQSSRQSFMPETTAIMDKSRKEATLLSLPVELQIYALEHIKMTKDLVRARLVCNHINLLIIDIVKRRLHSDLTSADGARCFIACNFRDPKWKEVGDLPRLSFVSMETLEFVIEAPFIPRSLVNLVNTSPESDQAGEYHFAFSKTPDQMTNVFTDEFDCELAIVHFGKDGRLRGAETLYQGELRFRPRYDSPSRRGSLTRVNSDTSGPVATGNNNESLHWVSGFPATSEPGSLEKNDPHAALSISSRPEWEWRTDQSPSWIPCEAQPVPHTNRLAGSIRIDDVKLEYQLVPKDIVDHSFSTIPSNQQPPSSSSAATSSTASSTTVLTESKTLTVIGIEIKKIIVNTGLVLGFLHDQLPEVQMMRVVRIPGPDLIPLEVFPTTETS